MTQTQKVLVAVRPALEREPRRVVLDGTASVGDALQAARHAADGPEDARVIAALEEELCLAHEVWQVTADGVERRVEEDQLLSSLAEPWDLQGEDGEIVPALAAALLVQAYLPVG